MDTTAERDLIARCRAGDERAFAELVDAYKNLVFALITRTMGNAARTEDLAQEVFIKVHRGLAYFRGDAKLSTWIYRIVHNVCSDERRKGTPEVGILDEDDEEGRARFTPASEDRQFAQLEIRDQLDRALAQLPDRSRELVAAYYFGERQYEELAVMMNIPLGTVKIQLHRAKRRLREIMEADQL